MITLIHGDDVSASRKLFISIKEKFPDAVSFNDESITLTDLTQEIEGGGLFSEKRPVFIEQLLSRKKDISERDAIIKLINSSRSSEIYLWEGKEIEKKTVSALGSITDKLFKIPKTLYLFLESINPGNANLRLKNFHQTLTSVEAELVFFMLIRHFRLLLAFSESPPAAINETKRLQPWQTKKIEMQAKRFTKDELKKAYNNLLEIEINLKTGGLSMDLVSTIDILLLEI